VSITKYKTFDLAHINTNYDMGTAICQTTGSHFIQVFWQSITGFIAAFDTLPNMQPILSMLATFMRADKVKKNFDLMQKLPTSRNKYKKRYIP